MCGHNGLNVFVESTQVTARMEYTDLVVLGNAITAFQQLYVMPGVEFEYLEGGKVIGKGHIKMQFEGSANVKGTDQA